MNQFYVSIIFLGIMLITLSLVLIAYDKKRSYDYNKNLDLKKNELVGIISDAEQMVEELNKFSDYIVTQIDTKKEELNTTIKSIDEQIEQFNDKIREKSSAVAMRAEKVANGGNLDIYAGDETIISRVKSDLVIENFELNTQAAALVKNCKPYIKTREKVIPLTNNKYREVLRLTQEGLDETEIAKKMNLGRGEIQLILEMNR